MDARTRTELLAGVERIQEDTLRLMVEAADLKRILDGVPPAPGGPTPEPPDGGPESLVARPPLDVGPLELDITRRKVMGLRGYGNFSSVAFPDLDVKLFYPEDPNALVRPVVEIPDLDRASYLPARLRMLGGSPLAAPVIVAPGRTAAVEHAVRAILEDQDELPFADVQCVGLDDEAP